VSDLEQGLCLQLLPHPSKKVNLRWLLARLVLEKDKMLWRGSIAYGWRIPIVALRDAKAVPTALWSLPGSNAETGLLEGYYKSYQAGKRG
jgi:hypothetical protein